MCLSFAEIQQLENTCVDYVKDARTNGRCSSIISIRQIFEERAERKRSFHKRASEKSRANLERWRDEQRERATIVATEKRKRLDELLNHLNDVKQRKINERKVNVELELQHLRYLQQLETESLQAENINLRKRIEYYQELSESIQDQRAQEHLKRLRHKDVNCMSAKSKLITGDATETASPMIASKSIHSRANTDRTTTTDYHSCTGLDDADDAEIPSEYEECLSADFVQKFTETANVLESMVAKKETKPNLCDGKAVGDNNQDIAKMKKDENCNQMLVPVPKLKRSISDVLNSNDIQETTLCIEQSIRGKFSSALDANRRKNITGSAVGECIRQQKQTCQSTTKKEFRTNEVKRRDRQLRRCNGKISKSFFAFNLL